MGSNKRVKGEEKSKEETKKEEKKRPDQRREIPILIIRVAGTDLDGEKPIIRALRKIKGIGMTMSKAICLAANVNPQVKLGSLGEAEIANLENVIKNPANFNIHKFLLNRRIDPETGEAIHLTSSDLDIAKRFDVQRYVNLHTYRGWRHMLGQPVRGQRTRSSFRETGRTVGVMKKGVVQKPGAAPAAAVAPASAPTAAKPEAKPAKK